ncbi:futalosine hydrolase [Solitalea sp. MAHUQ-68]|uniref:Futalosine hydrolase n=1 Tax=Solitalea agri TaxID=2953739 RepID=A0A9X2F1W0_9SPHI|nr:futalosine hydrolase [Solitalea agri]MCO4293082.1 futalosine hydrolase [Solitalea agri]
MKILVVAATQAEIQPFIDSNPSYDMLITGVGMVATAYQLTRKLLTSSYDLVINAGIAGSFDLSIELGTVVQVTSDQFSELGAEDGEEFIDLFSMGFVNGNDQPFTNKELLNPFVIDRLPSVSGITVNKVHGNDASIEKVLRQFPVQTESMEGAAFMYVCLSEGVKCLQIRSISNYVERRNRAAWNIPLAVERLNKELIKLVNRS